MDIKLYFTNAEKYLECGSRRKYFDEQTKINDMLQAIKIDTANVTIYCLPEVAIAHRYAENKTNHKISYKMLDKIMPLDETILNVELDKLYEGITSYIVLQPIEKWQSILGKEVYFTNSRSLQRSIIDNKDKLAFTLDDINTLVAGLKRNGQIDTKLIYKMFFDGKFLNELERIKQ